MSVKKKLIKVAIPLEAINAASAWEKSIRHGHPSTLHLWWARRPLVTCRAVLFAQLVDDPSEYVEQFLADLKTGAGGGGHTHRRAGRQAQAADPRGPGGDLAGRGSGAGQPRPAHPSAPGTSCATITPSIPSMKTPTGCTAAGPSRRREPRAFRRQVATVGFAEGPAARAEIERLSMEAVIICRARARE